MDRGEKRKILVPVDFSATSDRAVRQAHSLAKALGKDLLILHVIEEHSGFFSFFTAEQKQMAEETLREKLEEMKRRAEKHSGMGADIMILKGKPYIRILETAEEMDAALIVMGTRGEVSHHAEKNYVGNHTSKVARAAHCPVITVSDKVTCHNLRTILLPLDLTRETRQKVTNAIELASRFKAKIKVMSALPSSNDHMATAQLTAIINQVVDFIRKDNIECTGELVMSSPGTRSEVPIILNYADEQGDIDMILIMTQPELGMLDFFISSNALEMLKKSKYPVMSVQPKDLERTSMFSF